MDDEKRDGGLQASPCLPAIHLQSLSELERFRLQEISLCTLQESGFCDDIKSGWKKARKLEKRRHEQKDFLFGLSLSDVIAKDQMERHRILPVRNRRACAEVESSVLSFRVQTQSVSPSGILNIPKSSSFRNDGLQNRRRGGLSVDSISELDGTDRLLEALQLSHPTVPTFQQETSTVQLSLNPIYRQVPRIVESCCSYIEKYGLDAVGIFRIEGSKKRVEQLRKEFAFCGDTLLGEDTCVHDVSSVLKSFLRDLQEPLLPPELYTAFIHVAGLDLQERLPILQHLIFVLPPCNADTLFRILQLLHNVSLHEKDNVSSTGQQIPGNKMSIANLATVFGPNLLKDEKGLDGGMQSFLDSGSVIRTMETMIQHYQSLFMVPPYMHCEIMISLLQTDPEVVDFLLRRISSSSWVPADISICRLTEHWKTHVSYSLISKTPLETLIKLQKSTKRSGILETSLQISKRRLSRSHENLMLLSRVSERAAHPRLLPLFFRESSCP